MCLCFLSIQWLVNPTGSIFKWQGIDSLLMALLVSLTIAFTLLQARVERQELLAEDRTRVRVKKLASVY